MALFILSILLSCDQRFGSDERKGYSESVRVSMDNDVKGNSLNQSEFLRLLTFYEKGNWENIDENLIDTYGNSFSNNLLINELKAKYYYFSGDVELALHYNSVAEKLGAKSAEFYKTRSNIHKKRKEYSLAIDYINKAVLIGGMDSDFHLTKGEIYLGLGDSLPALKYMKLAFELDSSRLDIASELAYLYAAIDYNESAYYVIQYLQSLGFNSIEMTYLKAELLRTDHHNQACNAELANLLEMGEAKAGIQLLHYFREINNYDSLIFYGSEILLIDSLNVDALLAKGVAFDKQGYHSSALKYFNEVLEIDSLSEEALEGVRKVNRKIAYLRKLREQREAIPFFDFDSLERKNN